MMTSDDANAEFLSPEKKSTVQRLHQQEVSLHMQSQAIQEMLFKLDKTLDTNGKNSKISQFMTEDTFKLMHQTFKHQIHKLGTDNHTQQQNSNKIDSNTVSSVQSLKKDPYKLKLETLKHQMSMITDATDGHSFQEVHVVPSEPFQSVSHVEHRAPHLHVGFQELKEELEPDYSLVQEEASAALELQRLQLIREQRANAARQRIQQHQDALQAIETTRLQALERARRLEATELSVKHYYGKYGWKLLNRLFVMAKRRVGQRIVVRAVLFAAYRKVLMHMSNNVKQRNLVAYQSRRASQFHGWSLFHKQHVLRFEQRLRDLRNNTLLHAFRMEKYGRRLLGELLRAVLRRRMTNVRMDHYFEQYCLRNALRVLREAAAHRQQNNFVVFRHLNKRRLELLNKYLNALSSSARRSVRDRVGQSVYFCAKAKEVLQRLTEHGQRSRQKESLRRGMTMLYLKQTTSVFQRLSTHQLQQARQARAAVVKYRETALWRSFHVLIDHQKQRHRQRENDMMAEITYRTRVLTVVMHTLSLAARRKLALNSRSQTRSSELRTAFESLRVNASHGLQRLLVMATRFHRKNSVATVFRRLSEHAADRLVFVDSIKLGATTLYMKVLGGTLSRWRVRTVRNRTAHRKGSLANRRSHRKMTHVQRRAVKCFDKWMRVYRMAQRIRQLCVQRTERASFKLFHFWRAVSHISAVKRYSKRQRVRRCLFGKAWRWFMSRLNVHNKSLQIRRRADRVAQLVFSSKSLRFGLQQLMANCQRQKFKSRSVRGGSRLSSHRHLRSGLEQLMLYTQRRLRLKSRCGGRVIVKSNSALRVSKRAVKMEFVRRLFVAARRFRHLLQAKRFHKLRVFRKFVEQLRMRSNFQTRRLTRRALNSRQVLVRAVAWSKWCARTVECARLTVKCRLAMRWHASVMIRGALNNWLEHTSNALSRTYLKRTRLSCARRLTIFKRWIGATAARVESSAHQLSIGRQHNRLLLRKALRFLQNKRETRCEVRQTVRAYRDGVHVDLLQRRFFVALRWAVSRRQQDRSYNPKIALLRFRHALSFWRSVHNTAKLFKDSKSQAVRHIEDSHRQRAVGRLKIIVKSREIKTNNLKLSDTFYGFVKCIPALRGFKSNRISRQVQNAAEVVSRQHRMRVSWDKVMDRWRPAATARLHRKRSVVVGADLFQRKMFVKMFDAFLLYSVRHKAFLVMQLRAKKVHVKSLLLKSFTGLFEHYLEGVTLTERAEIQCRLQSARRALRQLKSLVRKRRTSKKAVLTRSSFVIKKCLTVTLRRRHDVLVKRKNIALRGDLLYSCRYQLKYLLKWLQYTVTRRKVGFAERQAIRQRRMDRHAELNKHFSARAFLRCLYLLRVNRRDRKLDRETNNNVAVAMDAVRCRQAFLEWRRWNHAKRSSFRQVVECVDVMGDGHLLSVFPALASNARARKSVRRADEYRLDAVMLDAWRAWKRFAHIQVKRVKHKRLRFKKRRSSFVSDLMRSRSFMSDMTGASSYSGAEPLQLDDIETSTMCSDQLTTIYSEAGGAEGEMIVEHCGDFRVSTQRRRILDGDYGHDLHLKQSGLKIWIAFRKFRRFHRKAIGFLLLRRYKRLFRRWRRLIPRNQTIRKRIRKTCHLFAAHHGMRVFMRLAAMALRNKNIRQIGRRMLIAHWRTWRDQFRLCGAIGRIVSSAKVTLDRYRMSAAFKEWIRSTEIDRTAELQVMRVTGRKLHGVVSVLSSNRRRHRKQRWWLQRARNFQRERGLRTVYSTLLAFLGDKYGAAEKLRDAHIYHLQYQCRAAMEGLRYLRRNRIAKDFDFRKQFKLFVFALKLNSFTNKLNKSRIRLGNQSAMRRALYRLLFAAGNSLTRRVLRRVRSIVPSARKGIRASEALNRYNDVRRKVRGLRCLREYVRFQRKTARRELKYLECHVSYGVFVSFRKLLSYARMRLHKRRNIMALNRLRTEIGARRFFHILDVTVASKWARTHQIRLLGLHAQSASKSRGLRALCKQKSLQVCHYLREKEEGDGEEKSSDISEGM